ncbi:MAG: hypothetical protein ACP5VP_05635 [Candidatus Limnocylindrales bacterium]
MSGATGLAPDQVEYRRRLEAQPDEQLDAWATELMRDVSIRVGVRRVIGDFLRAARMDEAGLERVFAAGGGAPATLGRTADGQLVVPAIELWCLVPGIRRQTPEGRGRIIEYLVDNFDEIVYI